MCDIREEGFERCLRSTMDSVASRADNIYVSIDIDVCDCSVASGTGNVTVGGISSRDFMHISSVLGDYPLAGLDIVEVAPELDASQVTANLAARLLFEFMFLTKSP